MNANERKYVLLVRLRRTAHLLNAFAFICVHSRSFAFSFSFYFKSISYRD